MNTLSYENKRNQFLKCESELDAILCLISSGEGKFGENFERLNLAREAAVETYKAYQDARGGLIAQLIDAHAPPRVSPEWPGCRVVYMHKGRGRVLDREGVLQRPAA